ncbi:hypothetical protein HY642_02175 [Candidatus Woesearchaeota archaeon]|nr:hypothetical protein [Candidatus Woesearchaeota archaeon]
MRLAADTGALLSLSCSRQFEAVVREHEICVPKSVVSELETFARFDDFLGTKAQQILKLHLTVAPAPSLKLPGLSPAECDVFAIAKSRNILALTDDVRAARLASSAGLHVQPSFYLLALRCKHGKMSKDEMAEDIKAVLKYRNWLGGALWEYALRLLERM